MSKEYKCEMEESTRAIRAIRAFREAQQNSQQITATKRNYQAVRQTACRFCGQDIEGFAPYRKGEWMDRGRNSTCPDGNNTGKKHAPILPLNG